MTIPFESGETVKNLVGKTLINAKNGKETQVVRWEGSNLIITDGTKELPAPAMTIVEYVKHGLLIVK